MNISQAVAVRIKELLQEKKLTQYKLEQKACFSHDPVKSIMKGKAKGVNLKNRCRHCRRVRFDRK